MTATAIAHELPGIQEAVHEGPAPKRIITAYGFWIFLLSDMVMFSCFFAAYAVLSGETAGGPTGAELFNLRNVAIETAFLAKEGEELTRQQHIGLEESPRPVLHSRRSRPHLPMHFHSLPNGIVVSSEIDFPAPRKLTRRRSLAEMNFLPPNHQRV